MAWTDEIVEQLKQHWIDGKSASPTSRDSLSRRVSAVVSARKNANALIRLRHSKVRAANNDPKREELGKSALSDPQGLLRVIQRVV